MDVEKVNKTVKANLKEDLKLILPEVFEDGKINFEKLKAMLTGELVEKEDDRFYFNWAQKSEVFKIIQTPAYGTLKPDKERSVDFDKTENIVIVGENLETLKLLLKPYFEKVKMIYIDPPYNTGKDFIYRDNFKEPLKDYFENTGQIDSEGNKLTTNTEASGRYHSDWLNFIYPRLFLAKNLLGDDGVIFISIDDHEVHHLRMIMDEIFGEDNFIGCLCWKSNPRGRAMDKFFATTKEYILVYSKNLNNITLSMNKIVDDKKLNKYSEKDGISYYKKGYPLHNGTSAFHINNRPNLGYTIYYNPNAGDTITKDEKVKDEKGQYYIDINYIDKELQKRGYVRIIPSINKQTKQRRVWRWSQEKFSKEYKTELIFLKEGNGYYIYQKDRLTISGEKFEKYKDIIENIRTDEGGLELQKIFGYKPFEFPKPLKLIKHLLNLIETKNSIILDFMAGSGTTGHSVWDLNKEDGGDRKFILVQLDEEVQDEEIKKEFPTVADICIERLRRVSEKYKSEIASASPRKDKNESANNDSVNQDFGFKVFKLDKSNFNLKDEFEIEDGQDVEELKKKYLEWLGIWVNEPLASGWKEADVVYETLLKEGMNLNSNIEGLAIKNNKFYYVLDNEQNLDFYISLDGKIDKATVEEIRTSQYKGKLFVFLDKALTDNDKINLTSSVRLKVI